MIEARTLSGQVPLIDHNDIVEMLHGHIYRNRKRRTLILNQIEQGIFLEMGRSRIGSQPPGKSDVHRPGE